MRQNVFDSLWNTIHLLFGGTVPRDGRKSLCWEKVGHIPDEAVPWIGEQFERMDSKPRNLTATIRDLWNKWQEKNPNRIVRPPHHCPYCIPNYPGKMLILKCGEDGSWSETVVTCGHCQPDGITVGFLQSKGWHHCEGGKVPREFWPLVGINVDLGQNRQARPRNVAALVGQAGQESRAQ